MKLPCLHEGLGYAILFSNLQTGVHMETTSTPAFSAAATSSSRDHSAITYGPNSTAVNPSYCRLEFLLNASNTFSLPLCSIGLTTRGSSIEAV